MAAPKDEAQGHTDWAACLRVRCLIATCNQPGTGKGPAFTDPRCSIPADSDVRLSATIAKDEKLNRFGFTAICIFCAKPPTRFVIDWKGLLDHDVRPDQACLITTADRYAPSPARVHKVPDSSRCDAYSCGIP